MKKKIILLVLCAVLLMIFTSSSYGGFDPKCKTPMLARPDQELKSPPMEGQSHDILILIIPTWKGFPIVVCAASNPSKEYLPLRNSTTQGARSKSNNDSKRAR